MKIHALKGSNVRRATPIVGDGSDYLKAEAFDLFCFGFLLLVPIFLPQDPFVVFFLIIEGRGPSPVSGPAGARP